MTSAAKIPRSGWSDRGRVLATGVVVESSLGARLGGRDMLGPYFLVGRVKDETLDLSFLDASRLALGKPTAGCELGVLSKRPGKPETATLVTNPGWSEVLRGRGRLARRPD
jgi:hypothetical protein